MREIKFRAWQYTTMYSWTEIKRLFNEHLENTEVVIMQYTGLKDKNGKEIYEGDILKIDRERKVVEWNNEKAGFAPFVNQIFSAADSYSEWNYTDNGKIIGNIHENPELLK